MTRCIILPATILLAFAVALFAADPGAGAGEVKKGAYQTSFDAHGPFSTVEVMAKRFTLTDKSARDFDLSKETYEVFVPPDYDGSVPYGLVVFVSSGDKGSCPKGYQEVLAKHRMIWVGANGSGNARKPRTDRLGMALDAVYNLKQRYRIDAARVYVSGISGGGSMAAILMIYFPDVFTGGFPMCAPAPYYADNSFIDMFIRMNKPKPEFFRLIQENSRFAICTGSKDWNRPANKHAVEVFKADKVQAELFEVEGMGHATVPGETFDKVLTTLDAPLKARAKPRYDKAVADERARRLDDAIDGYAYAAAHGEGPYVVDAKTKVEALEAMYAKAVKEVEDAIAAGQISQAKLKFSALTRTWPKHSEADVTRLQESVKKPAPKK